MGIIEIDIRHIREEARSQKAGVRDTYGYYPPNQFNLFLVDDVTAVENRIPKPGHSLCTYEEFTGNKVEFIRDFRVAWGEPVIVKSPKGMASDLKTRGDWAVVVARVMNGTGVVLVYILRTGKVAARLNLKRARCPTWFIDHMNSISDVKHIGLEGDDENPEGLGWGKLDSATPSVTNQLMTDGDEEEEPMSEEVAEALSLLELRGEPEVLPEVDEDDGLSTEEPEDVPEVAVDTGPNHSLNTRANG